MLTGRSESIEVFSPHSPAACAERLAAAIDSEWKLFGRKPVIGKVSGASLRLRKRIYYNNSFQSVLRATLRPEGNGTVISGSCGVRPEVRILMTLWLAVALLAGIPLSLSALQTHEYLGIAIPLGMLVFGFVLVRFGQYLSRNDAKFLREFLIQTLDGR